MSGKPEFWAKHPRFLEISGSAIQSSGASFNPSGIDAIRVETTHPNNVRLSWVHCCHGIMTEVTRELDLVGAGLVGIYDMFRPYGIISDVMTAINASSEVPQRPSILASDFRQKQPTLVNIDGTAGTWWTQSNPAMGSGGSYLSWGISLEARALYDPRLTYSAWDLVSYPGGDSVGGLVYTAGLAWTFGENPDGDGDRWGEAVATAREAWTIEQWPLGGTRLRTPPEGTVGGVEIATVDNTIDHEYTTTAPVWVMSLKCEPYSANWPIVTQDDMQGPGLQHEALFWFMPESSISHPIRTFWDVMNDFVPETKASSTYFLGTPNYFDPNATGKANESEFAGYHYANIPAAWNASYPNSDDNPVLPFRALTAAVTGFVLPISTTSTPYRRGDLPWAKCPGIKLDGAMQSPGLEFDRPTWMDLLPDGCTVVSATAEIRMTGVRRKEYNLTIYRGPFGGNNTAAGWVADPGLAHPHYPDVTNDATIYGWDLRELSHEGTGELQDDDEEEVTIFKVITDNSRTVESYTRNDPTNTHVHREMFRQDVFDATAVDPNTGVRGDPPPYLPKAAPWYPGGTYNPTVNPLQGAKVAHAVIGMQQWGHQVGNLESDLTVPRSLKELEKAPLWHPNGQTYGSGFQGGYPDDDDDNRWNIGNDHHQANGLMSMCYDKGDPYLSWVKARLGSAANVPELENYRYRFLGWSQSRNAPGAGRFNLIPEGSWEAVNLKECFQAIIDDLPVQSYTDQYGKAFARKHQKYRIYPILPPVEGDFDQATDELPAGSPLAECVTDEEGRHYNAAALLALNLPRVVKWPNGNPLMSHSIVLDGIRYQEFDAWEIRNVQVTVETPAGVRLDFRVLTPWD